MADEGTAAAPSGEPAGAPATTGTTHTGTTGDEGQPSATAQTTIPQGTGAASGEDSFFDPKDLDPALQPAYKNMQKAFSKKMEAIKASREKIDAYDNFSKDPIGQMQAMAQRMGYKLSRAEAAAAVNDVSNGEATGKWEPQTWDEVMSKAKEEVLRELSPMFSELQNIKKSNLEKILDDSAPDWREHEDEMIALLKDHPTLAKDPVKLYRLALPPEVLETRATQAALKKLQAKADSSRVGGTSTTKPAATSSPGSPVSFNEAVKIAKQQLAEKGIRAPAV